MPRSLDPRTYTNALLEGALVPAPGQRILTLGVGDALVTTFAQAVGARGHVAAVDSWLPDWRRLEQAVARAHLTQVESHFAARLDILGDQTFDAVAVDISSFPSAKALLGTVAAAAERLVEQGVLYAAGERTQGIVSFGNKLEALLGNAQPLAYRKGQRVIAAYRTGPLSVPDLSDAYAPYSATLHGVTLHLSRDPAVFARGEVDDASAMLAEALNIRPDDRILDPGCGGGVLGLVAARLAPAGRATLTDAEAAALDRARANAARNGITNVRIEAADIVDTVADERYTVVVCNPPFHERHEQMAGIAERFMRAAFEQLLPNGRLYFVANRFLAYESRLAAIFTEVTEVAGDDRYKVLHAVKKSAG